MGGILKRLAASICFILLGCTQPNLRIDNSYDYRQAIKEICMVEQTRDYVLNYLKKRSDIINYSQRDYWASFKKTHQQGYADCEDAALAIAALLSDDGYSPKILVMEKIDFNNLNNYIGHSIFLYEKNKKFGSGGINNEDWKEPTYNTIDELVCSFKDYNIYHVLDFSDSLEEITESDKNLAGLFLYKYSNADYKFIEN